MSEPEVRKFGARIFVKISPDAIQEDDIVFYKTHIVHCRTVVGITKASVIVDQPKGYKPGTKRIKRADVQSAWRWHRTESKNGN